MSKTRQINGVEVPTFLYGTAWKEDRTASLVNEALRAGFRGIDTANQRRHYHEEGVGQALKAGLGRGSFQGEKVFLQTKFTFRSSQDHRLPYHPDAPIADQVTQSFESSLAHLGVGKIDSYILHGPSARWGLSISDLEAWRAMEGLHEQGAAGLIGVSNFSADQLGELVKVARMRPAFVQNRCYAALGWDAEVRDICKAEGIVYQCFSLLTANVDLLRSPLVNEIAGRYSRTSAQVVFRFAQQVGMIPLTGTTSPTHMAEDLQVYDFELATPEVKAIEARGRP